VTRSANLRPVLGSLFLMVVMASANHTEDVEELPNAVSTGLTNQTTSRDTPFNLAGARYSETMRADGDGRPDRGACARGDDVCCESAMPA